jgi:hypothetical protein
VEENLEFSWEVAEGAGMLSSERDQQIEFKAPVLPGLTRLRVTARQREVACTADALITVTDTLVVPSGGAGVVSCSPPVSKH